MTPKKVSWNFIPFSKKLDRSGFNCGVPALDNYLKTQASQDIRRNVCKVYAAVTQKRVTKILGYVTLSSGSVSFKNFPENIKKKLPKYPIPVARIGRLAVEKGSQGQGIGKYLLMHALKLAANVGDIIGIAAVVVDAKDLRAKDFYNQYGFIPFEDNPLKLFLPIQTIKNSIP